jgi:nitroreductase
MNMKQPLIRRNFVKQAFAATAGLILVKPFMHADAAGIDAFSGRTDMANSVNETINTIQGLHTTHGNFTNKGIPDNEIELIKESCIRAANSSNMQTYSVVVVRDRKMMGDLCGYQGSCMMIFNVDYNRLIASAKSLGLPYYPGNITSFITASINTSLVAQTATIAARSLGIDSLLTNGIHRGNIERLWPLLNLPEKYCMPLIALVLGYADREAEYKTGRLDGKGIFHEKTYQSLTNEELAEIIRKYDDPSLHLGTNENWKANGHEHYLDWLFKEWLARDSKPTESETQLFVQLKKRGFVDLQG